MEYHTANGYLSSMFRPLKTFGAIGLILQSLQFVYAGTTNAGPKPGQIKNLVTFGDSFTDVVSITLHLLKSHICSLSYDRL